MPRRSPHALPLCWWASVSARPVLALCHQSTQRPGINYMTGSFPKPSVRAGRRRNLGRALALR